MTNLQVGTEVRITPKVIDQYNVHLAGIVGVVTQVEPEERFWVETAFGVSFWHRESLTEIPT